MPEETKSITARHPRALSSEYHKARKQLMLWSAILFIWELVGIDLDIAKDEPGNVGAIVKSLRSRQAVPWALLILVVYFLIKCWIEWAQCHPERKKVLFARLDFYLAAFVALLSIALYVGQAIRRVQFANLGGVKAILTFAGVVLSTAIMLAALNALTSLSRPLVSAWSNLRKIILPKK